jgi:class 3 adenylate cyclase
LHAAAEDLGIELRAGLHAGEIEVLDGDIGGVAVHIGARIAAFAGPRETLVSGAVPPLVAGSGIKFEPLGDHALKGIDEPWPIARVSGSPGGDP